MSHTDTTNLSILIANLIYRHFASASIVLSKESSLAHACLPALSSPGKPQEPLAALQLTRSVDLGPTTRLDIAP